MLFEANFLKNSIYPVLNKNYHKTRKSTLHQKNKLNYIKNQRQIYFDLGKDLVGRFSVGKLPGINAFCNSLERNEKKILHLETI